MTDPLLSLLTPPPWLGMIHARLGSVLPSKVHRLFDERASNRTAGEYKPKGTTLALIETLRANGSMTTTMLAKSVGCSPSSIPALMDAPTRRGLVRNIKGGRNGKAPSLWMMA